MEVSFWRNQVYSPTDITTFFDLFKGNEDAYGVTKVGEIVNGKAEANSRLIHKPLTPACIQRHFNGEESIGIAPIKSTGCCSFGAIDIDNYDYSLLDVINAIEDFNIPLVPCWSKSKKLHLYIFFEDEAPAEKVIKLLQWYANAFSCGKRVEIFPKQAKVSPNNTFYSWINIPYFDLKDDNNHRRIVCKNGKLIKDIESAIDYIQKKRFTLKQHEQWIQDFEYRDAPPCILTGLLLRDVGPGQRNNWLFSVGVYFRLKDENCDLPSLLTDVNHSLREPIPDSELENTVIKGFNKKTYFYMCASLDRCNKAVCRQTEFGIESTQSTGLEFGELTQYMTDPPYYEWIVNGQKLTFWSEQEILGQIKFRALCMRQLHTVPRRVKDDRWSAILTRALENVKIVDNMTAVGDFTAGSTFFDLTCQFFYTKRKADNMTQLQMGRIYQDDTKKAYVFMAKYFTEYIVSKNDFRSYQPIELRVRLQNMGAFKEGPYWYMPMSSIPPQMEKPEINFRDRDLEDGDF